MHGVIVTQNIAHIAAVMQRSSVVTAYASGQIIAQSAVAASCSAIPLSVGRNSDVGSLLRRLQLKVNDAAWLNAIVRVHLFRNAPSFANGDQGSFASGISESNWLGNLDITLGVQFKDPFVKGTASPAIGQEFNLLPDTGTPYVYAVLESRSAVTPLASKTFSLTAEIWQN